MYHSKNCHHQRSGCQFKDWFFTLSDLLTQIICFALGFCLIFSIHGLIPNAHQVLSLWLTDSLNIAALKICHLGYQVPRSRRARGYRAAQVLTIVLADEILHRFDYIVTAFWRYFINSIQHQQAFSPEDFVKEIIGAFIGVFFNVVAQEIKDCLWGRSYILVDAVIVKGVQRNVDWDR